MCQRVSRTPPSPSSTAEIPCPPLNRFLYATVGADWYWLDRLGWSFAQWQRYLEQEGVETWVAYVSGTPAGYFELETQTDGIIEIAYFGLLPSFIGHGLGGALLTGAVERAWALIRVGLGQYVFAGSSPRLTRLSGRGFRVFHIARGQDLPERPVGPWPGALP